MSENGRSSRSTPWSSAAGQAGLSAGYHLAQRGLPFVILDADARIGDHWRERWDSLKLYSPARYDSLPGHAVPGAVLALADRPRDGRLPRGLRAPVRPARPERRRASSASSPSTAASSCRPRDGARHRRSPGHRRDRAVPPAQHPGVRRRARPVDPAAPLARLPQPGAAPGRPGPRRRACRTPAPTSRSRPPNAGHRTILSGRSHGQMPIRVTDTKRAMLGWPVVEFVFRHVVTMRTPMGRKMRPEVRKGGGPLLRVRLQDLDRAGVERHDDEDRRRERRPADARRRHRPRRGQRDLGDRLPARLLRSSRRRSSARTAGRTRSAASARRCPACTSSASRSSTPSRRCSWRAPAATRGTSSTGSRNGSRRRRRRRASARDGRPP